MELMMYLFLHLLEMDDMYKAVTIIFIVSTMFVHRAAIAEPVTVAYASYGNSEQNTDQGSSLDDIDPVPYRSIYEIQQETSSVKLQVNGPFGDIWVRFGDVAGDFTMSGNGADRDVAAIEVNARNMETNRGMVRSLLKSRGFLDVTNFPRMKFVGTSFEWFSKRQAILKGDMTIKGTTRQVAFYVERVDNSEQSAYSNYVELQATATATIKRSSFGVNALLPLVSDDVSLYISINAIKKTSYINDDTAEAMDHLTFAQVQRHGCCQ
jgi:polyisoprenoid-binding protein YceI